MLEPETQPQVEETQVGEQPGETQVDQEPVKTQPGVKAEPRTYTEQQWTERDSARDREVAEARRIAGEQALQAEIARAEAFEAQAQSKDRQAIDAGEITEAEAQQRQQTRIETWQQDMSRRQRMAQEDKARRDFDTEAYVKLRIIVADDLATKYGVSRNDLLKDKSLTNAGVMEIRARELKIEMKEAALKGSETYDLGLQGRTGVDLSNMSLAERTELAYGPEATARRNKNKRR